MNRKIAIGDIHGCIKTFETMLWNVLGVKKEDEVYLLGDYIDRGPESKKCLDLIMELIEKDYNIHPLMGNHEKMMLDYYYGQNNAWKYNGNTPTLISFKTAEVADIDKKYIRFLESLEYYYLTESFVLTHAGLSYNSEDPFEDKEAMIWSRERRVKRDKINGRKVISGHTPHTLDDIKNSLTDDKIQLDGGCVYVHRHPGLGYLCALDLDSLELFTLKNLDM